ncbi:MAG: trigger factor [bacterium]
MNISLEDMAPCRKRIKIEVPAKQVEEELGKVTEDFRQYAKIPGFRPGKTPKAVVEKRFAKEIEDELKKTLVPRVFREAVQQKKLKVITQPQVEDLHFQRGMSLSFSAVVDLAPEFPLPDYKSIRAQTKEFEAVADADVERVVESMSARFADYRLIEGRPAQEGDFVVIDYAATSDGKPLKEIAASVPDLCERKNFWLWLKPDAFLPNFVSQLVGANAGETREVKISFPDDFGRDELKGKQAVYSVSVKEIKERILPNIDDEFTQKHFQMAAEEFRKTIRGDLENQRKSELRSKQVKEVLDQLNKMANFDLPAALVQHQTRRLVHDIVMENQQRGVSEEALQEHKEKIFSSAQETAVEHVKTGFLLDRIAETEKIEVTADDLNLEINMLAHRHQIPAAKLVAKIRKENALPDLEEQILRRKTVDFLWKTATES